MQLSVGVTGGIATGKSTVTNILAQQGFKIVDADQIAREVVLPQTPGWQQVVQLFGTRILQPNQELDRVQLGQIVFNNQQLLTQLNQVLQPLIRQRLTELIQSIPDDNIPVFFEIPLLFEQHYQNLLQKTLLVYATPAVQLQRLQKRNNLTKQAAQQRINSQMDLQQKRKLADFIINNDGNYHHLVQQVQRFVTLLT